MRLLNNQVQICHNEVWGYVCTTYSYYYDYDSDWSDDDAKVVCRELEYPPQGIEKVITV